MSLGGFVISGVVAIAMASNYDTDVPTKTALGFATTFIGLKVYEAIDVYKAPGYKIEKTSDGTSNLVAGIASIFPGFGLGHALQGRWLDKGWIFTTGGILTAGGFLASLSYWLRQVGREIPDEGTLLVMELWWLFLASG